MEMTPELPESNGFTPFDKVGPQESSGTRSKTSSRMRYEAEVEIIRRRLGSLETVRQKLGLSRRRICQLLMVDPSAWTRWTSQNDSAPPHVWRALEWYLALQQQNPQYHELQNQLLSEREDLQSELKKTLERLQAAELRAQTQIRKHEAQLKRLAIVVIAFAAISLGLHLASWFQ